MKTKQFFEVVCTVALVVAVAMPSRGATYSVLKSFGNLTNVTGLNPQAPLLVAPNGTLYGTALGEGSVGGTVFKLNGDGTGFTILKRFNNWLEGASPYGGVVL